MRDAIAHIPYGCYWASPFARWQGSLAGFHALELVADVTRERLAAFAIDTRQLEFGVLGSTVPQRGSFYGLPWVAGLAGAPHLAGPTISQACATGARVLATAAHEIAARGASAGLALTADRTSNSPHIYYPAPSAQGGVGETEDWILANFEADPFAGVSMVETAENVARKYGVSRERQDDIALLRYAQYETALAEDRAFQRRYMPTLATPSRKRGAPGGTVIGDEGVYSVDERKLRSLAPAREDGSVTYATQTHPADGNAGVIVADAETAGTLSQDSSIQVRILGFGQARTEIAHMPEAPVPACRDALKACELSIDEIDLVTSHNPFAVNDVVFHLETGFPLERMNIRGCSLVYGHPQGPTGLRLIIELIESLAERGGGRGLFQGCAAGDTAMAIVIAVEDGRAA
ncbi:MAG: thiolase family protein [Pseudomonadota bacterium]